MSACPTVDESFARPHRDGWFVRAGAAGCCTAFCSALKVRIGHLQLVLLGDPP
jgi:hypothetical protein